MVGIRVLLCTLYLNSAVHYSRALALLITFGYIIPYFADGVPLDCGKLFCKFAVDMESGAFLCYNVDECGFGKGIA